jgi:hypothetical protein
VSENDNVIFALQKDQLSTGRAVSCALPYLSDIIELGFREAKVVEVLIGDDSEETVGVNTIHDLMMVENILRNRARNKS